MQLLSCCCPVVVKLLSSCCPVVVLAGPQQLFVALSSRLLTKLHRASRTSSLILALSGYKSGDRRVYSGTCCDRLHGLTPGELLMQTFCTSLVSGGQSWSPCFFFLHIVLEVCKLSSCVCLVLFSTLLKGIQTKRPVKAGGERRGLADGGQGVHLLHLACCRDKRAENKCLNGSASPL